MKTQLAITDLTRMHGTRVCVAGYSSERQCIRPVLASGGLMNDWLYSGAQVTVRPFAIVELDLLENKPDPPHTEDWIINPSHKVFKRMLTPVEGEAFLAKIVDASVASIFGTAICQSADPQDHGYYLMQGTGTRSLGTIRPQRVWQVQYRLFDNGWDYRIAFTDSTGQRYRLAVTDLAFRYYLDSIRVRKGIPADQAAASIAGMLAQYRCWLRIGLARGWQKHPDRCYLQVTGIHTFPDYLNGQCFADLALSEQERAEDKRQGPRDIPF
jgi:hypothetical protein